MKNIQLLAAILLIPILSSGQGIYTENNYKSQVKYKPTPQCIKKEKISLAASIGGASYQGELNDGDLEILGSYGVGVNYRIHEHLTIKNEFNYFNLSSTNNLNPFTSNNFEFTGSLMGDLYSNKCYKNKKDIAPYGFIGLGILNYQVNSGKNSSKGNYCAVVPVGLGVKLKHSKNIDFMLEGSYRISTTDNLDNFRGNSVNNKINSAPAASDAIQKTVKPNKADGYFLVSLKVKYSLNKKLYSKATQAVD